MPWLTLLISIYMKLLNAKVHGPILGWPAKYCFHVDRFSYAMHMQVYETLTGVKVEGKLSVRNKENVLKSLPPEWPENPIDDLHAKEHQNSSKVLVVLDDDPTGTQTVHDIEVLTQWYVL